MARKQMLPEAPDALQGKPLKFDFISILAQMQRIGRRRPDRAHGIVHRQPGGVVPGSSRPCSKSMRRSRNMPIASARRPKILRSLKDAQEIRAQRAQQQQPSADGSGDARGPKMAPDAARLLSEAAQNGGVPMPQPAI